MDMKFTMRKMNINPRWHGKSFVYWRSPYME